jgi:hypothetical protein
MPEDSDQSSREIDPMEPLESASPEVGRIIRRVLQLEKERLYQQRPQINADITQIIKEEIQ